MAASGDVNDTEPKTAPARLIFAVITWNRLDYLKQCLASWLATRSDAFDWTVIIADDGSTDGTLEFLETLALPHKVHIVRNAGRYAAGQTNAILQLCQSHPFDVLFKADDDVIFREPGWDALYLDAVRDSGYEHLCYLNRRHYARLRSRDDASFTMPEPQHDRSGRCVAYTGVTHCDGSLFTVTPAMIERLGYADELNFPIRGQWHIDYSARACRAGFNEAQAFYDAEGSNDLVDLQANDEAYRCSLPWGDQYRKTKRPEELTRRHAILRDTTRVHLPLRTPRLLGPHPPRTTLNDEFEQIFVLNLDRRLDRWARVRHQAQGHGIALQRWPAIDGRSGPALNEWQRYAALPVAAGPCAVSTSREFFLGDADPADRAAHQERQLQSKAVRTPGAWGYLHSMIALLEHAIRARLESLLILDDDVLLHRHIGTLFPQFINQVPDDWTILQLGALQYHWEPDWISWYAANVYCCNGSSIGSHAVAIHSRAFDLLLTECRRFQLPYDLGPLHTAKRRFRDRAFTLFPNLMIQDVRESDIQSSEVQADEGQRGDNVYRWALDDYPLPALAHAG